MTRLDLDLERLGEALHASTTIDLAREERAARAGHDAAPAKRARRARPGRRVLAGGTLGLAGAGAALVLALGGTATTSPAFAVTRSNDGSVLVQLNYTSDQNLPQVDQKLASMGIHEQVGIQMAPGAATVSGPVTCTPKPGVSGPMVKVLVGTNGTEVIAPGQSAGNTAEGSFHLVRCFTASDTGSGNTGNS
ncbi:MAG TPA: hypothetical protein VMA77_15465 [Solirubrobacteraceae bacterium]|nr:hypothetical protein [Solirubrobacteraceae bacterium]